jgi:ABC-type transport system involved in multi-copper enzyme maturation permease subunit
MSVVAEQPPTAGERAPARPSGSLLRAEAHRFAARRFIRVLLALAVLGWLAAIVIGLFSFGTPDEGDLAAARQSLAQEVDRQAGFQQECLEQNGDSAAMCGSPVRAEDFRVEDFLAREPFDLPGSGQAGALGFGGATAVLAFLLGATWIGAEWSTRSLVALLFWAPRRMRVMGAKLTVLTAATALFAAAMQVAWLAMAGLLNLVAGSGNAVPAGFWGDLLATEARSVLLAVLAALLGFGLANLVRNTGAALGIGFVYFAIAETAVRILRPTWEPWLLSDNALGLLAPGGSTVYIQDGTAGADGIVRPTEYLIGNLQAGLVLGAVTAVVVGIGVVLFARRDIH